MIHDPHRAHGTAREGDIRQRSMQMMISAPKPVIRVQKKEVDISSCAVIVLIKSHLSF